MQEELKNIDLIDKYLRNTLSPLEKDRVEELLLNNPDFVKEVEVYKQIYKGIALKEEEELKQRLDNYFKEFQQKEENPKGKYRRLFQFTGAVAAVFIVGVMLFFFNKPNRVDPGSTTDPGIVKTDTIKKNDSITNTQKERIAEEEQKKIQKYPQDREDNIANDEEKNNEKLKDIVIEDDIQLALVGFETLPKESVREYNFQKTLSYTFNDKVFKLYGDPLISRLELSSIQIIESEDFGYLLKFQNKNYSIEKTSRRKRLKPISLEDQNNVADSFFNNNRDLKKSENSILIETPGVYQSSRFVTNLKVYFDSKSKVDRTYFSNQKEEGLEFVISANFDIKKAKVFRIKQDSKEFYYLVHENEIYELKEDAKESSPLIQLDIKTNKLARLFIERQPIISFIYKKNE